MKSMLHEAASVAKAVEKAWVESGKPTEFTIKILEAGQKGFLGFTKRPAIISITYDPKKQNTAQKPGRVAPAHQDRPKYDRQDQRRDERNDNRQQLGEKKELPRKDNKEPRETLTQNQQQVQPVEDRWSDTYVTYVSTSLEEILAQLQMATPFSAKVSQKILTIAFDKKMFESTEEERCFFISLSYLLIQFLKKKFKKKFRGFQLILTSGGSK